MNLKRNTEIYADKVKEKKYRIIFILTFFLIIPTALSAQSRINLSLHKVTMKEFFDAIEKQSTYRFSYRDVDIQGKDTVTISIQEQPVETVLRQLFVPRNLQYQISGNRILVTAASQNVVQGDRRITGKVTDENGEPVIGANIIEKGTTNGTVTDVEGSFTLLVKNNADIQVSYIGYIEQTVNTSGRSNIDLVLMEDTQALEEVVVIGFGTQKKVNLTGAVATIRGEEMLTRPVANTASMLQGQVPGLYVMQSTGQPGEENISFRIRGYGSYGSSTSPLILINGVEGDISGLDPHMIESVSVLKDAASAAVYGARAANGVILVTTKQGSGERRPKISYNGNIGIHTPTKMYELVANSAEYMTLANIAKDNSGSGSKYPEEEIELYRKNGGSEQYPNFDWLGYMFNPAIMHTHNLSLAGSTEKTTYNMSLNYLNQEGTLRGHSYERYNVTLDLTSHATDWLQVGAYSTMKHGYRMKTRQNQNDALLSTMSQAPTYKPWLPDDGTGKRRWTNSAYGYESHNKNMVAIIGEGVMAPRKDYDINTQIWTEVKFQKNLVWHTKGAVRLNTYRVEDWRGSDTPIYMYHSGEQSGTLDKGGLGFNVTEDRQFYTNLHTYLRYNYNSKDNNHNLMAQVIYSQETFKREGLAAYRRYYPFDLKEIDAGTQVDWSNSGGDGNYEWALQSFVGRLIYNYRDRYLLEANARYDGSSKLSSSGRWGLFPSFSGAWRLTEESFIKDTDIIIWLSNLKIRGSWGQLGNQDINNNYYPYQAMIANVSAYPFDKTNESPAYIQTAFNNEHIKWETTTMTNVGLDLQLFNRLNVVFDWYNNVTSDILRSSQVSGILGLSAPTVNAGKLQNRGIELAIDYNDIIRDGKFRGLSYFAGITFDRSRNKLLDFGAEQISGYYLRKEGLPYNEFYMLKCIGIFADQAEIDNSPKQFSDQTRPGDLKYADISGPDGAPDGVIDNYDRTTISGYYPGFEYSVKLGGAWKGFDLYVFGQGVQDKKFYTNDWGVYPFRQGSSPTRSYLDGMWTEENPHNAKHPRLYWDNFGGNKNTRSNSYFLRDASYFRIKNITLGYTVAHKITERIGASRLRVYFSGDNILTFTKFDGLDPERTANGQAAQYPQNRSYSFGLNVEF